jgi:hypothetical protein
MIPIQTFVEQAKIVFIDCAKSELEKRREKVNVSRLSILTGLRRREVQRFASEDLGQKEMIASIPARVLGLWEQSPEFLTKAGKPRVLTVESFEGLVKRVSQDLHPGTVLFELKRHRAVEEVPKGIRMLRAEQILSDEPLKAYEMLSRDLEDLFSSVEQNIAQEQPLKNLHAKTEYDSISESDLAEIKTWFLKEGTAFHMKARQFLAQYDRDINPERNDGSQACRVCIGTFSRVEGLENE